MHQPPRRWAEQQQSWVLPLWPCLRIFWQQALPGHARSSLAPPECADAPGFVLLQKPHV